VGTRDISHGIHAMLDALVSADDAEKADALVQLSLLVAMTEGSDAATLCERGRRRPQAVRFFWRHTVFEAEDFQKQLEEGVWTRLSDDAWQFC